MEKMFSFHDVRRYFSREVYVICIYFFNQFFIDNLNLKSNYLQMNFIIFLVRNGENVCDSFYENKFSAVYIQDLDSKYL